MTSEIFLDRLEEAVNRSLEDGERAERVCVLKNNGLKLDGFSYSAEGRRERPTVYVNQYYREEMTEEELLQTAAFVVRTQRESVVLPQEELADLLEYENVKSRIYVRLISREKNQELLNEVPHIPFLDLALVFYLQIPELSADSGAYTEEGDGFDLRKASWLLGNNAGGTEEHCMAEYEDAAGDS